MSTAPPDFKLLHMLNHCPGDQRGYELLHLIGEHPELEQKILDKDRLARNGNSEALHDLCREVIRAGEAAGVSWLQKKDTVH